MEFLITSALALAISAEPSVSPQANSTVDAEAGNTEIVNPDLTQPSQPSQPDRSSQLPANQVTCPPGQFASAFSDVYPTDWAYQAVNNLASVPVQCFDLPASESNRVPTN
jgi:hypothetical protein